MFYQTVLNYGTFVITGHKKGYVTAISLFICNISFIPALLRFCK